jgi:hypothetical protein
MSVEPHPLVDVPLREARDRLAGPLASVPERRERLYFDPDRLTTHVADCS